MDHNWIRSHLREAVVLFLLCTSQPAKATVFTRSQTCSSDHQLAVFSSVINCQPRPTLVELPLSQVGAGDAAIMQVIPGHVIVDRCSGSCHNPSHTCLPTSMSNMSVEIMTVQTTYNSGAWNTMCSVAHVEKHEACQCSCQVTADQCNARQEYDPANCRCQCRNRSDKVACLASGKIWNSEACSCVCQPHMWRTCTTGFTFDYQDSCSCIRTSVLASGSLNLMIGFVVIGFLTLGLVVIHLKKRQNFESRKFSVQRNQLEQAFSHQEDLG